MIKEEFGQADDGSVTHPLPLAVQACPMAHLRPYGLPLIRNLTQMLEVHRHRLSTPLLTILMRCWAPPVAHAGSLAYQSNPIEQPMMPAISLGVRNSSKRNQAISAVVTGTKDMNRETVMVPR